MAPSAWLKRLCSAPGKTKNIIPSWRIERSRCSGRVSMSARSSASARTNPCTGSRIDSILTRAVLRGTPRRFARRLVPVGRLREVAEGAQQFDELGAAAQDAGDFGGTVGERQRQ